MKNYLEFDFKLESGHKVTVEAQAEIDYEVDVFDDPSKVINNLEYKCTLEDGIVIPNRVLTEDDIIQIEDHIYKNLVDEQPQTESDFYDRYDDYE